MKLVVSRTLDAPIDAVWATQIGHEQWPARLPNFRAVERVDVGVPFGPGSSARITQPGLGTATWTVGEWDVSPSRRRYSWSATSRGATYVGRHEVEERLADRTLLTLTIEASGPLVAVFGFLLRGAMRKSLLAEADVFEAWAREVAATSGQASSPA